MQKEKLAGSLIYYIICGLCGAIIAAIIWVFLRLMNLGIDFLWQWIPEKIDFKYYPLILCTAGGLVLGIFEKKTGAIPEDLETVIGKVKKDKFYPYDKIPLLCIAALLPLIFGGSLGPEAGLTGVIVGLCYWAGSRMSYARSKIPDLMQVGISATLGTIFYAPLFGLIAPAEECLDSPEKTGGIAASKMTSTIIAVVCSTATIFVLGSLFGGGTGLPRIGGYEIHTMERIWGIPLAFAGVLAGVLFLCFGKWTSRCFGALKNRGGLILSTTLSGLVLGIAGTFFPLAMFSGEPNIPLLQDNIASYGAVLLIFIGILKLFLTNMCIQSGWMGGHFFPVIFCGVSIGYGLAMLSGLDLAFCAAVVTAGILGYTMKKPVAVTLLLLLCFDIRIAPWILVSAFIGSIVPSRKGAARTRKEADHEKQ